MSRGFASASFEDACRLRAYSRLPGDPQKLADYALFLKSACGYEPDPRAIHLAILASPALLKTFLTGSPLDKALDRARGALRFCCNEIEHKSAGDTAKALEAHAAALSLAGLAESMDLDLFFDWGTALAGLVEKSPGAGISKILSLLPADALRAMDDHGAPSMSAGIESAPVQDRRQGQVQHELDRLASDFIRESCCGLYEKALRRSDFTAAAELKNLGIRRLSPLYEARQLHNPLSLRLAQSYGHSTGNSLLEFEAQIAGSLDEAELLRLLRDDSGQKAKCSKVFALRKSPADPLVHILLGILSDAACEIGAAKRARPPMSKKDFESALQSIADKGLLRAESSVDIAASSFGSNPCEALRQLRALSCSADYPDRIKLFDLSPGSRLAVACERADIARAAPSANATAKQRAI